MAHFRFLAVAALFVLLIAFPASAYDWIVGESGIALQWQPNCQTHPTNQCAPVPNPISLTGATITVYFAPASSVPSGNPGNCSSNPSCQTRSASLSTSSTCQDPTGTCGVYVMTSSDFTTPGQWYIEFQANFSNGLRKTQIIQKDVGPALN